MSAAVPSRLAAARAAGDDPNGPLLVALHGTGHQIEGVLAFARDLVPARELIAPVGCWGTYVGAMDLSNYTWFHEVPDVADPDPISFGRSLLDVEQLIGASREAAGLPAVVLVGAGQGATLALALTAVIPDALAAAVAIGGRPVALPAGAISVPASAAPVPTLWLGAPAEHERAQGDGALEALADRTELTFEALTEDDLLDEAVGRRVADWLRLPANGR